MRLLDKPVIIACFLAGCTTDGGEGPPVSKSTAVVPAESCCLSPGQHVPPIAEREASGELSARIVRGSGAFVRLVRVEDGRIVFKDEEGTAADRYMTRRLRARMRRLAVLVEREWAGVQLRVTEAWDETLEHGRNSLHYEGRAADITTSDLDTRKLGRLARLAVEAGCDWVYFEDGSHVHVSVRP